LLSSHQNASHPAEEKFNDRFAEWDTWETIHAVESALAREHDVTLVEANLDAFNTLRDLQPEIVFNIAEGLDGISREAQIPAILEMLQIPYSGSDALTLATCLDKARTKEILSYHHIPNAPFALVSSADELKTLTLSFPMIVKPVGEGSGKGIFSSSLVHNTEELHREVERALADYQQPALIEEFLPGKEFTVAILGNGTNAKVLPIIEISFAEFPKDFVPLYSYEAKWILDGKDHQLDIYKCPAPIDDSLAREIEKTCLQAYTKLRCRDWSRIDVRLDRNGVPNIIEINPLPGILPDPRDNSCYPSSARAAGYSYDEMLLSVLNEARKRYGL
jgi:D-alanine-D-alanine ligase